MGGLRIHFDFSASPNVALKFFFGLIKLEIKPGGPGFYGKRIGLGAIGFEIKIWNFSIMELHQ